MYMQCPYQVRVFEGLLQQDVKDCVETGPKGKKHQNDLRQGGVYVWVVDESTENDVVGAAGNREKKNKRGRDKDKTISEADLRQQQDNTAEGREREEEVRSGWKEANEQGKSTIHRCYHRAALFGWRYGNRGTGSITWVSHGLLLLRPEVLRCVCV